MRSTETAAATGPGAARRARRRPPRAAPTRQAAAVTEARELSAVGATVTAPTEIADDCASDVSGPLSTWLATLAPGSTWSPPPGACYLVDGGVTLRFPAALTIDGGTFEDLNRTARSSAAGGTDRGQPALRIVGGSDITLENLRIVGAHSGSSFRPSLAFQAGIELEGTTGAVISDVTITRTFGDGLDLEPLRGGSDYRSGHIVEPVENLVVQHTSITRAGRQGITAASVDGATFSDVRVTGSVFNAWDFEADQRDEGAKDVLIDGCTFSGINIAMEGPATGPITVRHCAMPRTDGGDAVSVDNRGGRSLAGPIVLADDELRCAASVYVSCLQLAGASAVTVADSEVTIGWRHDAIHEAAYTASDHTHVTFTDDVVEGFGHRGAVHGGSTATVVGGSWSGRGCRRPAVCPWR